jgi:uncharacterized membrane protein YeiH
MPLAVLLDYLGVAVFAATGALVAARRKHDVMTFLFFAAVTGLGGGTLRDLLMGAPVFWLHDQAYLIVCAAIGALVWLVATDAGWGMRALLWLDAVGLSAYAVLGAGKAMAAGVPAAVAVLMGVLTGTFGGIVRDVLAGEPSVLLRREIYVTAALVAAAGLVLLRAVGIGDALSALIAFGLGLGLRAGALLLGWTLPPFRGRAGSGAQQE